MYIKILNVQQFILTEWSNRLKRIAYTVFVKSEWVYNKMDIYTTHFNILW